MSDRDLRIHMARAFLAQAANVRRFSQHTNWHAQLLRLAAARRLRTAGVVCTPAPAQGELF